MNNMNIIKDLPTLILGYNRFDKFTRCVTTLHRQGIKKIYISIDGPKNDFDKKNQEKIFDFCYKNNLDLDIQLKSFSNNYGCRIAPIKGITWFFKENEYGLILEDDVIVSKKCIEIFSLLLERYYFDKNIMSLSSFNEFTNKNIESIYHIPVWRSWGWATWSERWNTHLEFSKKIEKYSILEIYNLLPENLRMIETAELIKSCQLNLMDAWDYEFNFSHIVNKKKSLTIGGINNYVYGFDDSATHTKNVENTGINFDLFLERKIDHTNILEIDDNLKIKTLEKCGFAITEKKNFFYSTKDFLKSIYYASIFYLRKIKRNIQKN